MTAIEVIKDWINHELSFRGSFGFSSVHIQSNVVKHGLEKGIVHTPDMYSRRWREIRERGLFDNDYLIEEIKVEKEKVKWFKVTRK